MMVYSDPSAWRGNDVPPDSSANRLKLPPIINSIHVSSFLKLYIPSAWYILELSLNRRPGTPPSVATVWLFQVPAIKSRTSPNRNESGAKRPASAVARAWPMLPPLAAKAAANSLLHVPRGFHKLLIDTAVWPMFQPSACCWVMYPRKKKLSPRSSTRYWLRV